MSNFTDSFDNREDNPIINYDNDDINIFQHINKQLKHNYITFYFWKPKSSKRKNVDSKNRIKIKRQKTTENSC